MVQSFCDSVARCSGQEESNNDMTSKKRRRHTPDQIIRKLAEGNKLLAAGQELDAVCRHLEIAESTWHRWLAQYGGMKASDAKRLKELEADASSSHLIGVWCCPTSCRVGPEFGHLGRFPQSIVA